MKFHKSFSPSQMGVSAGLGMLLAYFLSGLIETSLKLNGVGENVAVSTGRSVIFFVGILGTAICYAIYKREGK